MVSLEDIIDNVYVTFSNALSQVAKNRKLQRSIEEHLVEHHQMTRGSFIELVAQPEKLEGLEREELLTYIHAVHQFMPLDELNPMNYFTRAEMKAIKDFGFEQNEEISFPYTFSPVIRVTNEDFLLCLSYKEIAQLTNYNLLTYNFSSQRLAKKRLSKKTGKIVKKKNIKNKSVQAIMKLMLEGKYSPSTLLFNVLVDGKSKITYSDGQLTIHEGSTLNIIDGAHRQEAVVRIMEENPDFEGYMNIDLKHYPLEKAQKLLAITNTVNQFDKTLVKYYGGEEYGQEITKYLMGLDVLKDRIEIKTALSKGISITNFAIVSEAIQSIFEPQTTKDKYDVQDVLKKYFEYMIPSYENQLIRHKTEYLKTSWFPHHNMFVGHIAIAKKLFDKYGKDFPVDQIINIIDHINFSKDDSSPLNEIMAGQGKANSNKVKQQIREYIEAEADKILN